MNNKRLSKDQIISKFHDGMTLIVGGFGFHGCPYELVQCVKESGARHLTLVALDMSPNGWDGFDKGGIVTDGHCDKIITAHGGIRRSTLEYLASGKAEVEFCPMGSLAERIRAGGMGLGGVLVKTGLGTVVEEGKQKIEVKGETYLLEEAIYGDIALVKAQTADDLGNLTFVGTARNANKIVATAAKDVICEVERFVEIDEIPWESVHTPGIFVDWLYDPSL